MIVFFSVFNYRRFSLYPPAVRNASSGTLPAGLVICIVERQADRTVRVAGKGTRVGSDRK